ncbi:MAG: heme A synthase [Proteobacteria bacterium]|nr:heme A synthase [Pseudomonadota bacterium]
MAHGSSISTRALGLGLLGLAGAVFALITLGALVRANGAGLACPDWPLCHGQLVPNFDLRIALEWGHRALAGLVSLGLAVISLGALRDARLRSRLRGRLLLAWTLLVAQALLGALTVWLLLAPWTVTAHLLLGNAFCALLVWMGLDLIESSAGAPLRSSTASAGHAALAAAAVLLVVQMLLGGMVASHAAGLACAFFPTCDGVSIAPTFQGLIGLHVLHRLVGFGLLAALAALAWFARGNPRLSRLARTALRLTLVQIALGIANVLGRLPVEITALHSATAAAIALTCALMVREALYAATARVPLARGFAALEPR